MNITKKINKSDIKKKRKKTSLSIEGSFKKILVQEKKIIIQIIYHSLSINKIDKLIQILFHN